MSVQKRLFDLFFTIPGLIVLLPLFLIIALLIKLDDGAAVFFFQERIGWRGKPFRMWKFRSMVENAEKIGTQLTVGRDNRITRTGHFLRASKIDELPQLINVLLGEMSLVGPRPEVPRYVNLYTPEQAKVLELVPGMTDLASIAYRNENDILANSLDPEREYIEKIVPDKIQINLQYAARASIWNDFLVILKTVKVIP
jgi:lipopolysaccharide/colanic/teichoic acid biosynthesis glycosyltransferase